MLGVNAERDARINVHLEKIEQEVARLGMELPHWVYPGTVHVFLSPSPRTAHYSQRFNPLFILSLSP